uniref:FBA_2 domain-containing protein n=1 Tax=Caenorhabditis tropicalis TaxID=1561998 RepID=A0A1I7U4J7_9PELO
MDRFPLFRLPVVAISEVMKMFDLFEITMLSMCSKRTHRWIKSFRVHRPDLKIEVSHYFNIWVEIKNDSTKENLFFKFVNHLSAYDKTKMNRSIKIGNHPDIPMNIEIVGSSTDIYLYFDVKIEGIKAVTEYFCSLFEKEIYGASLSTVLRRSAPVTIMEWILKRQKRIHFLMLESWDMTETIATNLLSKFNNAEIVMIDFEFRSKFKSSFKFEGTKIEILNSDWFTLNNLLNISCFHLFLAKSKLTSVDMNEFLKHWMTNDLKFKEIKIEMEEIQLDVLFSEISVIQRTNDVKRIYKKSENQSIDIYGGFDIKRNNDGVTATIVHDGGFEEVRREFWMIVWG